MFTSSLTISSKGQITLPKRVRDALLTNIIKLELTDDNKVTLFPLKNVAGRLSIYRKNKVSTFTKIRESSWYDNFQNRFDNE